MIRIGLTGGSGCGKGYVCEILGRHGVPCLDTDKVSRMLYRAGNACRDELVSRFGNEIAAQNGDIDRKALFRVAFSDDEKYAALNEIAHRHILNYCRSWLFEREAEGVRAAVIDAPLLIESGFDRECDVVISVMASESTRIRRIMRRDGISREDAELRLKKQKPDAFYLEKSDFVIYNDGDGAVGCEEQTVAVLEKIL